MEPDDGAAKASGLGEGGPVAGKRDFQPWRREVFLEARGECRMGGDGGDVGDEIFGSYFRSIFLRQKRYQRWRQIWNRCLRIAPEGKDTATEGPFVVVEVRNTAVKVSAGPEDGDVRESAVR
jgi:hypothetical protein